MVVPALINETPPAPVIEAENVCADPVIPNPRAAPELTLTELTNSERSPTNAIVPADTEVVPVCDHFPVTLVVPDPVLVTVPLPESVAAIDCAFEDPN